MFLFGFAENDREDISDAKLARVRIDAESWLAADAVMIEIALNEGLPIEVKHDA